MENKYNLTKAAYTPRNLVTDGIFGCRASLYKAVKAGHLRITKQGARSIFLAKDVAEYLSNLEKNS